MQAHSDDLTSTLRQEPEAAGEGRRFSKQSIGRDAAIALYESGWWKTKTAREIAEFQMGTDELCMPFGDFQQAMESALGRPVWTHEFGLNYAGLQAELMGERPAPSFADILGLIPADKLLVAVVGEAA